MGRALDISAMLRQASPTTRRELLKLAGAGGIAAPALMAMLAKDGVKPVFAAPAAKQEGQPVQGGTFVVTGHQEVAGLSPDDYGPSIQWTVIVQIHNALMEQDENFVYHPVLAEAEPEISEDGLTYTFKLRQGVLFHDGTEFTSADVKYTYEWVMNPENASTYLADFATVASVDAPDPYTVVVNLKQRNAAFHSQIAEYPIVPAAYHAEVGQAEYRGAPIGTGPFKLVEWNPAASTLLEANPDHFRGRPNFDQFRMDIVPEPSVRTIGLETGDSDSSAWPLVTEDNIRLAEDTENFTTFITSTQGVNHIPLNNKNPKLADKRVRQAMMHAIDRQALIDDIFQGTAVLATSNLSPSVTQYYNPDVKQYPYDPAAAAALLDEAGWVLGDGDFREKDGETLSFVCTTITGDQVRRPEAEVVQQYLREVGIDMQLEEAPVATILEQLPQGNMDASLFNWTYGDVEPDAATTLGSTGANNFSQFENARVDELLAQGLQELDPEARAAIYKEIQAIVAEEVPFLYIMYWDWYNIFNKRIKGLPESALGGFELYIKAWQYWIEE